MGVPRPGWGLRKKPMGRAEPTTATHVYKPVKHLVFPSFSGTCSLMSFLLLSIHGPEKPNPTSVPGGGNDLYFALKLTVLRCLLVYVPPTPPHH